MSFEIFAVAIFLLLALFSVTLFSLVTFLSERPDTTFFRVVMEETDFLNFFPGCNSPTQLYATSLLRFLDHTVTQTHLVGILYISE
jgi:hypothetical protein